MFKPLAMQRVTLYLLRDDAAAAALVMAECGIFEPQHEEPKEEPMPERAGPHYKELFRSAEQRLSKILTHLDFVTDTDLYGVQTEPVSEAQLAELNDQLGEIWRECLWCEENQRLIKEETRKVEQLNIALDKYEALGINLGLLQGKLRFLDVHIGSVASADIRRLRQAVGLIGYYTIEFMKTDGASNVILAGMKGAERELKTVLEVASFRRLALPPEFRDYPGKLREDLQERTRRIETLREELKQHIEEGTKKHKDTLMAAAYTLAMAAPYVELANALCSKGALARLSGWVPSHRVPELRRALITRLGQRLVMQNREPCVEERSLVPSVLRHPQFLRPFAALVRNYGVPRYGELDPTWLFAITFVAMFGMMFGDIGHGAVISLSGLLLRQKLRSFSPILVAAGISSTLFGFVYGSLFGYDGIIHAIWISPLSDPGLMLLMALYWGIGFILLATAITVRNRLAEHHYLDALLGGKGLAGMMLYLGVLVAAWRWVGQGSFGIQERGLVLVPLLIVIAYKWQQFHAPLGERVLVVFIEGFETFMSYIANTLSFLRLAAFSLNHVALAVAVFTLADMMDTTGHWVTVVLGNVFIIVLEGAIVAIQVLRLEYYEGFARFFSGDGREFRPLRMSATHIPAARSE